MTTPALGRIAGSSPAPSPSPACWLLLLTAALPSFGLAQSGGAQSGANQSGGATAQATIAATITAHQQATKHYQEAAAALQKRGNAKATDWREVMVLRTPMDQAERQLLELARQAAGNADAEGRDAWIYLGLNAKSTRDEARAAILAAYADDPAAVALVRFPVSAQQFRREDASFLAAAIDRTTNPVVRAAATLTLAEGLAEVGKYFLDLREFDSSLEQAQADLLERTLGMVRQTFAGGEPPAASLSREELLTKAKEQLPKLSIYGWREADPDALRKQAEELLRPLLADGGDQRLPSVSFKNGRLQTTPDRTVAEVAEPLRKNLFESLLGQACPDFAATDLDGRPVQLSSLRGKVVMLDFWATWCAPCRAAMPGNAELAQALAELPFQLVTCSVDENRATAAEYLHANSFPFTNWHLGPNHPALRSLRIAAYPTYVVVDDLGVVRSIPRVDHDALRRHLTKLAKEAAARAPVSSPIR
ncbi:MAG: hypothetical protein RL398_3018 [Planctomycetota bacterium]